MKPKVLPLLEVGTAYLASDFEYFEYSSPSLPGNKANLRLHLSRGTSIDLQTDDAEFARFLIVLIQAYPVVTIDFLKERWPALFSATGK